MWRLLVLLLFFPSLVLAGKSNQDYTGNITGGGRVNVVPGGTVSVPEILARRSYNPNPLSGSGEGGALLRDLLNKPMPGPKGPTTYSPPIKIESKVTAKALAKGFARGLPVIGQAIWAAEILDEMGCQIGTTSILVCDKDFENLTRSGIHYCYVGGSSGPFCAANPAEFAAAWADGLERSTNGNGGNIRVSYTGSLCEWLHPWGEGVWSNEIRCRAGSYSTFEFDSGLGYSVWKGPVGGVMPYTGWAPVTVLSGNHPDKVCQGGLTPGGECEGPTTPDDFANRGDSDQHRPKFGPGLAENMDKAGADYETENPRIQSGPGGVDGGRTSERQNPDGTTTTTDRYWQMDYKTSPSPAPEYGWTPHDITTTWPPATVPTPYVPVGPDGSIPGVTPPPGGTSTSSTTVEIETCGLPSTPPCKIDESGTPPPDERDPPGDVESIMGQWRNCVVNPSTCLPALPSLNWTFTLPSTCTAIPLPAFAEVGVSELDLCQFQSTFHDLMSVVWLAAGVFGSIRLFTRDAVGS